MRPDESVRIPGEMDATPAGGDIANELLARDIRVSNPDTTPYSSLQRSSTGTKHSCTHIDEVRFHPFLPFQQTTANTALQVELRCARGIALPSCALIC